jgi:hypothetical protein
MTASEIEVTPRLKHCSNCNRDLPETKEFFYWHNRDSCWQSRCIPCRNAIARKSNGAKHHRQELWDSVAKSGVRVCTLCGKPKPLEDFLRSKDCVQGRTQQCKICVRARADRDKARYQIENWAQVLLTGLTSRVKKGSPFDLSRAYVEELWVKQGGLCYWFNVPMLITPDAWHCRKPSLDRLDGRQGYLKGNVVLTCLSANLGRNTTGAEDFRALLVDIRDGLSKKFGSEPLVRA